MHTPELIKVCGLSTADTIDTVIQGGATHAGFIFFEKSPRHLPLDLAQTLNRHVAGRIAKVAVCVDADDEHMDKIVKALEPDVLQLHGEESPGRAFEVKARYGLPVWKALPVALLDDLERASEYDGIVDWLLFDAKPPKGADLPGGNGITFDWRLLDDYQANMPWLLSGGLNPQNLQAALSALRPHGIDVSSGVESAPGVKSADLIREFLKLCPVASERS